MKIKWNNSWPFNCCASTEVEITFEEKDTKEDTIKQIINLKSKNRARLLLIHFDKEDKYAQKIFEHIEREIPRIELNPSSEQRHFVFMLDRKLNTFMQPKEFEAEK
jgi:hypothetical protein